MHCSEFKPKLEPYAAGKIAAEERASLEAHLATCEGCRLELELARAIMGSPSAIMDDEPKGEGEETPAAEPLMLESPTAAGKAEEEEAPDEEVSFADLVLDSRTGGGVPPEAPPATPAPGMPAAATAAPAIPTAPEAPVPEAPVPEAPFVLSRGLEPPPRAASKPEKTESAAKGSWDFEPVDLPRDSSPPRGSLFFAEEALARKKEEELKGKNAFARLVLWSLGGLAGLTLLGFSVWIALAFRTHEMVVPEGVGHGPSAGTRDVNSPVDSMALGTQGVPADSFAPDVAPPEAAEPASPPGADIVSREAAPTPTDPRGSPLIKSGTLAPGGLVQEPVPKPAPATPAPRTTMPRTGASGSSQGSEDGPPPVPNVGVTKPAPQAPDIPSPVPPAMTQPPMAPLEREGGPDADAPPAEPPLSSDPRRSPDPTPTKTPDVPQPAPASPPAESPAGSGATAPPEEAPAISKPIDRLHLATLNAAKNQDLEALKKLKSSWKTFIRSAAGPDRARAKREFADCLWAIQDITVRDSDRREALAAYRDYVLSAPAGGADARTVGRMRYLEDFLAD